MKTIKRLCKLAAAVALLTIFTVSFNACTEQTPFTPDDNHAGAYSLAKKGGGNVSATSTQASSSTTYTQSGSMVLRFQNGQNHYSGGKINLPNGSSFQVEAGSLTPPPDIQTGADITITMQCIKNETTNELIYNFSPSGSQFNPPAELWFDWHELGSKNATLYLIDADGNYVPTQPEYEDKRGKRFMVHVQHFSRYAVAWSN